MVDLYGRQQSLTLNIPQVVTVIGVGGIGAWAAIDLAMSGVPTLYLFDPDTLEESNRNRLPFCQGAVNRPKVEIVAEFIKSLRPDCTVVPVQAQLEGVLIDIQAYISQYFLDCTDSPKTQITLYSYCMKHQSPVYVRAGYDGTHITVTSTVSGWIKTDGEEVQYQVTPSWVAPAQIVAALAVAKILKYPTQEVSLDIAEIGVPLLKKRRRLTQKCQQ